jgi:hypothetical protein
MREPHGEEWFFFDGAERALVTEVLDTVGALQPRQRVVLEEMVGRLRKTAELIRDSPSITASSSAGGGGRAFSANSLIDQLCRVPDWDLDLHIPTKAVLGQAYLIAKINFLKALGYTLETSPSSPELRDRVEHEVAQSIYTKLAEELFISIVTDQSALPNVKMGAARFLFRIWEERLLIDVDDFAPLLESAWEARSKLLPVLGTMLGTHEVFRLFQEARDKRFLDYFGEDDVGEEQLFAFEEFLFGLSHEEIGRIRSHMTEHGRAVVSIESARKLLGSDDDDTQSWRPHDSGAPALYTSYKKRRVNALHRSLTGASGPKKTAEEYVMIAFLHRGASPSQFAMKAVRPVSSGE